MISKKNGNRPGGVPLQQLHTQGRRIIEVDVENTTEITCSNCGGQSWIDAVRIFKASRLITGTPQDIYARTPCVVCAACGQRKDEDVPIKTLQIAL